MPPTQKIGPYVIEAELGRGAMGVVFRGLDPAIGRPVAIKVIRSQGFASAEESATLRLRFAREASAAGKLTHPNIVTIYQLGEEAGLQYLVMELVNGQSLDTLLQRVSPVSAATAIPLLAQVADALDYAHAEGIVHRDVKPANILVRPDGKIKVTDFGVARIASQTVTQTGMTMGTPAYMAPEQIMAARVDGRADQYSLAVMAFEMLTGAKPFEADSNPALIFKIASEPPRIAHEVNPSLSPAVTAVLSRGLAKPKEERYAGCTAFVEALAAACAPAVAATAPPPLPYIPPPASRPEPAAQAPRFGFVEPVRGMPAGRLWGAVAAVAVLAVLGAVYLLREPAPAAPEKTAPAAAKAVPVPAPPPVSAPKVSSSAAPATETPPVSKQKTKKTAPLGDPAKLLAREGASLELPLAAVIVPAAKEAATPHQINVGANVQAARLVRQPPPVYPALAKQARVTGTVRLAVVVATDGTVREMHLVSGHPMLVPAAIDAVKQWVYQPTLLNGEPIEVKTEVDVNFTLNQ